MERFVSAAQQEHSGDISCCSAWQLLAFASTEFVEMSLSCGSVPGMVQTQHKLSTLRNYNETVPNMHLLLLQMGLGPLQVIQNSIRNVACGIRLQQGLCGDSCTFRCSVFRTLVPVLQMSPSRCSGEGKAAEPVLEADQCQLRCH